MDNLVINQPALELRAIINKHPGLIERIDISSNLIKNLPYYGYIEAVITGDIQFFMFSNGDDPVAQAYFWLGTDAYESTSLKIWTQIAKRSVVMFDIGAYSGVYSLAAATSNRKCKLYAFEALDRVYSRLLINKKFNNLGNLNPYNIAISKSSRKTTLNIYSGESILVTGSAIVDADIGREIFEKKSINSLSLDDFVKMHQIQSRLDAVKIDVEGAEHLVLAGMKDTIEKFQPDILLEMLPHSNITAVKALLNQNGYRFFHIDEKSSLMQEEQDLSVSDGVINLNRFASCKDNKTISSLLGSTRIEFLEEQE